MSVVVVTDSSAHLPPELLAQWNIRQVPLHLMRGSEDFREGVDAIDPEIFNDPEVTTSGVNPSDLWDAYHQANADSDGDGVVAVHISRRLSSTWSAARLQAEKLTGRVRVADSRSVGLGVGWPVLAAAQAAAAGADCDRVYETAVRVSAQTDVALVVDNLVNLRHSGRISATTKLFGSAFSIKPVLRVIDGALVLKEKQRTLSRAIEKMVDAVVDGCDGRPMNVGVQHVLAPESAREVADRLSERINIDTLITADIGPVLGSHVGENAVGIAVTPAWEPFA